ncbi:Protein KRI1-like protein [Smittium culicis]|uniref:Protein KRI1-like protein n=1 Tax=Smittium culicis TaxID=133412 RepID=A0A1R1YAU8_9FUNG|nr:Protein KRI1-like protein [Smittium culicis]OMJ24013.1 Protein KRI1-like protein [Smittium culicis]OMJ27151.1 Protein KRI1-like protein [Smittium culicis]
MTDFDLKINEKYAQDYIQKKQKEELAHLKEKYAEAEQYDELKLLRAAARQKREGRQGSNLLDYLSDSQSEYSSSSEEDEVGEMATPQLDIQIIKTIEAIKNKDSKVYDNKANFYDEQEIKNAEQKWKEKQKALKASKPITMKDYQRKILLEDGGIVDEEKELLQIKKNPLSHVEEQQLLKASFNVDINEDEEGDSGLFLKRDKTTDEKEDEDKQYRSFLLENLSKGHDQEEAIKELDFFKESKTDPNQAFLVDFILNRGWIEKDGKKPKYEEIVADEVDEIVDYEAETYEKNFNFRFQEKDGATIKTYSRNIDDSLRREDNKRKTKRKEKNERKLLEKQQKVEELKRLKNLKKAEIMEKLEKIKEITGNDHVGFNDIDLEKDYDPEEYDAQMGNVFNDDYYVNADSKKPEWNDDIEIDDIVSEDLLGKSKTISSKKSKKKNKGKEFGISEIEMDADYLPGGAYYRNKDIEDSSNNHDLVEESYNNESQGEIPTKELKRDIDEYYQLNYEDIIGDLPTRFKYQSSKPVDFGLTPVEILLADDKELNEVVSLKKLAPFRPQWKVAKDMTKFNKKTMKSIKKRIQKRLPVWEEDFKVTDTNNKPTKGSKKAKK